MKFGLLILLGITNSGFVAGIKLDIKLAYLKNHGGLAASVQKVFPFSSTPLQAYNGNQYDSSDGKVSDASLNIIYLINL